MASTCSGFTLSFTLVGNPAPPRPTTPQARTASTKLSRPVTCGGVIPSYTCCSPSVSMTMAVSYRPLEPRIWSSFFTLPDTPEWMGADTKPPASAISWPTFTVSPALTTGLAGAPMCMDMGTVTTAGTGMRTGGRSAVFFLWGTCTPCNFTLPSSLTSILNHVSFPHGGWKTCRSARIEVWRFL